MATIMRTIPLTRGMLTLVDDELFDYINQYKWQFNTKYASRSVWINGKKNFLYLHHLILPKKEGYEIDHINRDRLDNRSKNLRYATSAQNHYNNAPRKDSRSGIKGVQKIGKKWQARIVKDGKTISLGYFISKNLAILAYNEAAREIQGEFAYLNAI